MGKGGKCLEVVFRIMFYEAKLELRVRNSYVLQNY